MADDIISSLIEKFSCDLVLADPEEPETLSSLLPLLKKLHHECRLASLETGERETLNAKNIIMEILQEDSHDRNEKMKQLEEIVSKISTAARKAGTGGPDEKKEGALEETEQKLEETELEQDTVPELPVEDPVTESRESRGFRLLKEHLDKFGLLIAGLCPDEIPDLGAILNNLDDLLEVSRTIEPQTFYQVVSACKEYVETITLENIYNTRPIEEGFVLLKSILIHLKNHEEFIFDYSDVLELLHAQIRDEKQKTGREQGENEPDEIESQTEPKKISDDDMEILVDFVSEAVENLETIEVNLIDLEQDPSNIDIINDIFRPFHTIKGVSGFLSLIKINKLAHATENLLDSARSGEFVIEQNATDAILESVDMLKLMVNRVGDGIQKGVLLPDADIETGRLIDKLKKIQQMLAGGETQPLGEILIRQNAVSRETLDDALEIQKGQPDKKIGEILVEQDSVAPGQVESALSEQIQSKRKMDTQVKVSTQKLDDLVDYAGELVIAQSMLRQQTAHDPSLAQSVTQLGQIVTNMQTIAMSMRMIPIKATFMKMIRLVRDLSRKSAKPVKLNMTGEDTEIDRNVVDALYEPMVHMIRNSVDHGIEGPDDRTAKDKPPEGQIFLRSYHKGGHIIIEIEDDGKGLDKDRILEKAKTTGLISGDEQMTDSQIYDLIMEPGFSTAKKITDVSGRGVGMDVVKSGIEKFRGQLNIESTKDEGTKFTISLPLTLAIIDGMLVQVSGEKYVIPTIAIQKAFKPAADEYFTVEGKGEMVKDRGKLIPLIRLDELYSGGNNKKKIEDCLVVVVESKEESRALLIDELLGKDEYVIKSLGSNLEDVKGLAGGAILADGRVGLILDIFGVFALASTG